MSEHYIDGGGNIPMKRSEESVTAFTMRRIRAEIIEECAKFVEQHQETITETAHGSRRHLTPRKVGNQMGIAYVDGLRALVGTASPPAKTQDS